MCKCFILYTYIYIHLTSNYNLYIDIYGVSILNQMEIVHVQSVLPQDDAIALKRKSGESSIKEGISKAVYHYLKCDKVNENEEMSK